MEGACTGAVIGEKYGIDMIIFHWIYVNCQK